MHTPRFGEHHEISHLDRDYLGPVTQALMIASQNILRGSTPSRVQVKQDNTLVTDTDFENEVSMNAVIMKAFPGARIVSEETQNIVPTDWNKGVIFFIDPLDGTRSYAAGQQFSSAGISVYKDGEPYFAGMAHPYEGYVLLAQKGEGTWKIPMNTESIPARTGIATIDRGVMAYMDGHFVEKNTQQKLNVMQLMQQRYQAVAVRSVGSNISQQAAVAIGQGNFTLTDAVGGYFDLSGALLIEEAGGMFIDGQTGLPVTSSTHIAIGGHQNIIKTLQEGVARIYEDYTGFR